LKNNLKKASLQGAMHEHWKP